MMTRFGYLQIIFAALFGLCWSNLALAQTPPQISEQALRAEQASVEGNGALGSEEKKQIIEIYEAALSRMADGNAEKAKADVLKTQRENAQEVIENLDLEIAKVRQDLARRSADLTQNFADLSLEDLESLLAEKRSEVGGLRTFLAQTETARLALDQRPAAARIELTEAQERTTELRAQIAGQTSEAAGLAQKAGNSLVAANLYERQNRVLTLEQEIASIASQRNIMGRRISLVAAQILQTEGLVTALQIKTGSARAMNAEQRFKDAELVLQSFAGRHAVVQAYGQENVNLSLKLSRSVETDEDIPASEAQIRTQLSRVEVDANVTEQIISTKSGSKNYGVHLRQLRKKLPSVPRIGAQIRVRQSALGDALFERIINQETLQNFNASPLDIEAEIERLDTGLLFSTEFLQDEDIVAMRRLHDNRRELLIGLASFSVLKAAKLEELNGLQAELMAKVESLSERLDNRLLWLPSTDAVDFSWPGKTVQGVGQTFSPANIKTTGQAFASGFKRSYGLMVVVLFLLVSVYVIQNRFQPILASMSGRVGRVQKDSYLLTPIAVLEGALKTVAWFVGPLLLGLIFLNAVSDNEFVGALMRASLIVAGLIFVFMVLRAWSVKGALFDLHFRVDRELRDRLVKHIPWLLATQIVSVIFIALTGYSANFDPGPSALGVLGFLIGAISISVFAAQLAWSRSAVFRKRNTDKEGIYIRNEKWFFLLAILLPLITSLLAVFGYFETARLILSRFFLSFCVLIGAYIAHGLLRRTVVIAQRRLALQQERARRDRVLRERREKVAAEERGEIPTPKLDYDSIDLETINRQSSQLVNITIFICAAGLLWALWASLLPALSVFSAVEIWSYMDISATGGSIEVPITLWSLMQAAGIALVTWLAARNLPGFLEIFILKRLEVTQGSRFAIVTVLGYMIFIIGMIIAFNKLGTQWSQFQWVVAALGVGIGFGLQAIFANFISGLIILFERPVRIGDFITIGNISGSITRIQIRATTLLDLDNKEILIPNQELISQHVTNWTLSNAVTRLIVDIGIAYGSDTKKAHELMLKTIEANPNVLANPEPSVLFLGFGDSSLDFEIRVFLRSFGQRFRVSHEIHMAVDQALREANIEIPFPQRDLHIKPPAEPALLQKPKRKTATKHKPE